MLKLATTFSGIGAIEESLKQLGLNYQIIFATDNGERKLDISLDYFLTALNQIASSVDCQEIYNEISQTYFNDMDDDLKSYYRDEIEETYTELNTLSKIEFLKDIDYKEIDQGKLMFKFDIQKIKNSILNLDPVKSQLLIKDLYNKTGKDNFVKKSYFANYDITEERWHEDIRFINANQYKDKIDILVGGSPCQSFSTYGKKMGLDDTRGTLFYDYARIIQESKPKVFIYENVRGLLTHDKKRTWQVIQEVFNSLNYDISYKVLNAVDFGLPQLRSRIFVVGCCKDLNIGEQFSFPEPIPLKTRSTDYLDKEIPNKYYLGRNGFYWMLDTKKNGRRSRVNQDIIGCQTAYQQDNWIGDFRIEPAEQRHYQDKRIYIGNYNGEPSVARKMTPAECLRLMGFKNFKITLEDKHIYRQAGNSIAVPVLNELLKEILKIIR